jgi:hypothetical protein
VSVRTFWLTIDVSLYATFTPQAAQQRAELATELAGINDAVKATEGEMSRLRVVIDDTDGDDDGEFANIGGGVLALLAAEARLINVTRRRTAVLKMAAAAAAAYGDIDDDNAVDLARVNDAGAAAAVVDDAMSELADANVDTDDSADDDDDGGKNVDDGDGELTLSSLIATVAARVDAEHAAMTIPSTTTTRTTTAVAANARGDGGEDDGVDKENVVSMPHAFAASPLRSSLKPKSTLPPPPPLPAVTKSATAKMVSAKMVTTKARSKVQQARPKSSKAAASQQRVTAAKAKANAAVTKSTASRVTAAKAKASSAASIVAEKSATASKKARPAWGASRSSSGGGGGGGKSVRRQRATSATTSLHLPDSTTHLTVGGVAVIAGRVINGTVGRGLQSRLVAGARARRPGLSGPSIS